VKRKEAAIGLFFMTRYSPDSGFLFMLTSENKRKIQRRWKNISLQKSSSWRRERKRRRKFDGKAAA
jgi:hypothetical protein